MRDLREAMTTLTPAQRRVFGPYLQAGAATIKQRLAWLRERGKAPEGVIPFPSLAAAADAEQSNRITQLALRLTAHGFNGAQGFVRKHIGVLAEMDQVVDRFDALPTSSYDRYVNPGAALHYIIHQEIAESYGTSMRCSYCRWNQPAREGEATS
ncbi:MAG: hypothetical protein IH822_03315 [Chloroflexi bacterium]|nr:hypothetical protein [Chloroflexota bacterium]